MASLSAKSLPPPLHPFGGSLHRSASQASAFSNTGNGFAPIDAALQFITACGGLDQAKAVLATVEQLKAVV